MFSSKIPKIFLLIVFITVFCFPGIEMHAQEKKGELFPTLQSREQFAKEVSLLIGEAWRRWQNSVLINDISVDGSRGILSPGDMANAFLTPSDILKSFERKGRSQDYIACVKLVAQAVGNGMGKWQRGYRYGNIIFPQGASCTYTMPPSNNIPATLASGGSSGETSMTEDSLYSYMLYRTPRKEDNVLLVFRAAAKAVAESFTEWKKSCSIVGILASGGIAPQPAPMGSGPGPVRGAQGYGGKLIGSYVEGLDLYEKMVDFLEKYNKDGESRAG